MSVQQTLETEILYKIINYIKWQIISQSSLLFKTLEWILHKTTNICIKIKLVNNEP